MKESGASHLFRHLHLGHGIRLHLPGMQALWLDSINGCIPRCVGRRQDTAAPQRDMPGAHSHSCDNAVSRNNHTSNLSMRESRQLLYPHYVHHHTHIDNQKTTHGISLTDPSSSTLHSHPISHLTTPHSTSTTYLPTHSSCTTTPPHSVVSQSFRKQPARPAPACPATRCGPRPRRHPSRWAASTQSAAAASRCWSAWA